MTDPDAKIHVVDKTQVKSWPSYGVPAADALIVPPEISFRLDEPPTRDGQRVILRGLLENAGQAAVAVTVFADGHGAAGTFGLLVEPAPGSAKRVRWPGPPQPAAPPPAFRDRDRELGARLRHRCDTTRELGARLRQRCDTTRELGA